jgi:uncharacterized small protein (DUF1192 family)
MVHDFKLSSQVLSNGKTEHKAKLLSTQEPAFLIGYSTKYINNFGIYNANTISGLDYKIATYEAEFGFWATFIAPTAKAESNNSFLCLNTYDRAKFTFGFMQYAAHVPDGDFIDFFKKLLKLPEAKQYFPRLTIKNDRIHYIKPNTGTLTKLEDEDSTEGLMDYLNPSLSEVDNQELICAARLIHWTTHKADTRKLQVSSAIKMYQDNMKSYHNRFGLDGVPAKVCFMICDILHQGRGTNDRIAYAINTNGNYEKAYQNLCSVGQVNYQGRINILKAEIKKMEAAFNKKYNAKENKFL